MKKSSFLLIIIAFIFLFSACGATGNTANSTANSTANNTAGNQAQNGLPADDGNIRGIVTAISNTQIEIAKMNGGGRGNGDGRQNNGGGPAQRPSGGQQNPPSDASRSPQARPSMDTSNMEKVQYTIDSNTKIIKQTRGDGKNEATETQASLSDIQKGTMVTIETQESNDKAALKIIITEEFGLRGGGSRPGGNQSAPAGTGAQT